MRKGIYFIFVIAILFIIFDYKAYTLADEVDYSEENNKVLVLMYHHITEAPSNGSTIHPKDFEEQLVWLKENGFNFISMQEFYDIVYNDKEAPEKSVLITFDDGYRSVYEYAYPLAQKYEIPMSLFVVYRYIEEQVGIQKVTEEELKELHESNLFYIGNHSYDMHKKMNSYEIFRGSNKISNDIALWNDKVQYTDSTLRAYAYPYGISSRKYKSILKKHEYKLAFTTKPGIYVKGHTDPYKINRINVGGKSDNLDNFRKKINEYYTVEKGYMKRHDLR